MAGADDILLSRCQGLVLDVGCGQGRLVAELNARGIVALGVDVSRQAVNLAAARGACVLRRNVTDRLPLEGRWGTILLADGNIGIGGDVDTLEHVVFDDGAGHTSHPVARARVGSRGLHRRAARRGFSESEIWFAGDSTTIVVLRA